MNIRKGNVIKAKSSYKILDKLGEGNYGEVFLAKQRGVGRHVALKILSKDKRKFSGLQKEAWVQGKLSHPNIVSVHDFAVVDGQGYLIMEYVEHSLEKVLKEHAEKREPVRLDFALRVIRGCMEALAHAHYSGVVHGDIKPGNILVNENGNVKLSDFSVARLLGTTVKDKQGSAMWAAPEVLRRWKSDNVWDCDYQSDLFSLGVVAYVLLAGRHPFADPCGVLSYEEVICNEGLLPSLPAREKETIPKGFTSVCMKLIQRDRNKRYTSAKEALVDLQEIPMTQCPFCSGQNPEAASFCNWCGGNLKTESIVKQPVGRSALSEAHSLFMANQNIKALAVIEKLLGTEKDNAARWSQIGFTLNSFEWYKDATIVCTRALDLDPKLVSAYQTRGFAKSNIGEFMDAIGDFSQALSLVASDDTHKRSQILYQRGYALMRLSKMREACKDASESLELDPGNERTTWLKSITCRSKPGSIT